jgi:hypothetical protein
LAIAGNEEDDQGVEDPMKYQDADEDEQDDEDNGGD